MSLAIVVVMASSLSGGDQSMLESLYMRGVYGVTSPSAEINESADTLSGNAEVELERGSLWGVAAGVVANERYVDVLVEGELTRRTADIERSILSVPGLPTTVVSGAGTEPVETWALMGNAWGRTDFGDRLKPYAGGGIGAAYLPSGGLSEDGYYAFAWQLGAGLDYQFKNGWALGLGYRYFRTTASDEQEDPFFTLQVETETFEHSGMLTFTVPLGREVSRRFGGGSDASLAGYDAGKKSASTSSVYGASATPKAKKPGLVKRATGWIPFVGDKEAANAPDTYDAAASFPASPAPSPKAPPRETRAPKPTGTTGASGPSALVQLGAFTSRALAEAKWAELARSVNGLNGQTPTYQAVVTKSQQSLVRLRVGPMPMDRAKAVCAQIVGQCIIAAP